MTVTAAVATAAGEPFSIEEVELDDPRDGELRVRMVACGVCHTDAIVRDQWYPTPLPAVLGHEGAGVVEAVGPAVRGVAEGDHVLLSFDHCGRCPNCTGGRPGYCSTFFERNFGGRRQDGSTALTLGGRPVSSHFFGQSAFASHANVQASSAVVVPPDAPLELLAPLGCGIQTGAGAVLRSLDPPAGSSIAIFGAGAVGLSAVLAAGIAGCTTIVAVDRHAERLEIARAMGATHTVDASSTEVVPAVRAATGGGAQYALETTGVPAVFTAMTESLAVLGHGGVVGAAALGTTAPIDIGTLLPTGIRITMIVEGDSVPSTFIPQLIALREAGSFRFDDIVRPYALADINDAFEDSAQGRTIKPVLVF